ncbi:hypothetical protein [Xanthomonas phage BUDD]|nr:hypothetical protein [Xanthomonas phage BUDD]
MIDIFKDVPRPTLAARYQQVRNVEAELERRKGELAEAIKKGDKKNIRFFKAFVKAVEGRLKMVREIRDAQEKEQGV